MKGILFIKNIFLLIIKYMNMNNSKFLKIVILVLVLINLSKISFIWLHRPTNNEAVGDFFAKELHFTKNQIAQFEVLKKAHREAKESLRELQKKYQNAFLDLLKNPSIDSVTVRKAADKIMVLKESEELAVFYHFQKVRAICNEKQKQKFDEIIKDAVRMIGANQNEGCRLPPPRRFGEDSPPPPRP